MFHKSKKYWHEHVGRPLYAALPPVILSSLYVSRHWTGGDYNDLGTSWRQANLCAPMSKVHQTVDQNSLYRCYITMASEEAEPTAPQQTPAADYTIMSTFLSGFFYLTLYDIASI